MVRFPYRHVHSRPLIHMPSAHTGNTTRRLWTLDTPAAVHPYNSQKKNCWYDSLYRCSGF